jgi:hypothetical protein
MGRILKRFASRHESRSPAGIQIHSLGPRELEFVNEKSKIGPRNRPVGFLNQNKTELGVIVLVTWLANFLHFKSFGFYEDDWYFFAVPYSLTSSDWLRRMTASVVQFQLGRPLQFFYMYLFGYVGTVFSSIEVLYVIAFVLFAGSAVLMYFLLRHRYPPLFCTLATLLYVMSPLTTIRQFLNGQLSTAPAFICAFSAMLLYQRRSRVRWLAYPIAVLALLTYEPMFFLFLAAPLFTRGRLTRKRIWSAFVHVSFCFGVIMVYFAARAKLGEARVDAIPREPIKLVLNVVGYCLYFTASSVKPYIYAAYVSLKEVSFESVLLAIGVFIPVLLFTFRSVSARRTLEKRIAFRPSRSRFRAARLFWWLRHGVGAGFLLIPTAYALAFFHLYQDWTYPLSGRDTRASVAASFGSSILVAAILMILMTAFRTKPLRVVSRCVAVLGLTFLFCYSLVVQADYVKAWEHQKSFLTQAIMQTPDARADSFFIVETPWIGETLFPGDARRPSIGFQRHGLEVGFRAMFGWANAPRVFFTYADEWRHYLTIQSDGKVYWKQASFPGGWSRDVKDAMAPGGIFLFREDRDGTLTRSDKPVLIDGTIITPPPIVTDIAVSNWSRFKASPFIERVVPSYARSSVMRPLSKVMAIPGDSLRSRLVLRFPDHPKAGLADPLVVSGRTGAADFVSVVYLDNHQLQILIDHWGFPLVDTFALPYMTDREYTIDVILGDKIIVALDDVVVATRQVRAFSTEKSTVFIGENPFGGGVTGSQFSGLIVSKAIWTR